MSQEILDALHAEKAKIEEAISALEGETKKKRKYKKNNGTRRKVSEAMKRRLSLIAKKRWAAARKAGNSTLATT